MLKLSIYFFFICFFSINVSIKLKFKPHSFRNEFPFWNNKLPLEKRLEDLMERLTIREMVEQMANGGGYPDEPSPGIPRLNIPPYNFDNECLRGVAGMNSTAFPMPIGLAASFNPDLVYEVASAISIEARAIFNEASEKGEFRDMEGLSCFAPMINLVHHPLWGRMQESFGEDPHLIGQMAENFVKGLQGSDPNLLRVGGGCKHFVAHSGPENIPSSRMTFDSKVSEKDLRVSFFPPFQHCVSAGVLSIMCSYNSLNGIPTCASKSLLTEILRKEWGFPGFVVSDMGALENIMSGHKFVDSLLLTAKVAVEAGVDLELHDQTNTSFKLLEKAVEEDLVPYDLIYQSVKRLFWARFKLGHFDPPSSNPYSEVRKDGVIQSGYHRTLASSSAAQSFVLLKNLNHTLPLHREFFSNHLMMGPMCDNLSQMFGGYSPLISPSHSSTPYQALKHFINRTRLIPGCHDNQCNYYNSSQIVEAVKDADLITVCLGTGQDIEGEDKDRPSLEPPGLQNQLLKEIINHSPVPIILLLFSGCPMDVSQAFHSPKVSSIIQCFYPAQSGGEALGKIIFISDSFQVVSPSGRLPFTWPLNMDQIPPMENYSMENRTYRYSPYKPLFPFGYGLSYTSFVYSQLKIFPKILTSVEEEVEVKVQVGNSGQYDAYEVVQIYISWRDLPRSLGMPQLQLVAFKKVFLFSDSTPVALRFKIPGKSLRVWVEGSGFLLYRGAIDIYVGGQQPFQEPQVSNVLHDTLSIIPVN